MTTIQVSRDDIRYAIREAIKETWEHGDGWAYARLYADGHISTGCEISQLIPAAEFDRIEDHPVTFFSKTAKPGDRYTQWMEDVEGLTAEEIEERINDDLADLDLDEETDEAVRAIEEAGYTLAGGA